MAEREQIINILNRIGANITYLGDRFIDFCSPNINSYKNNLIGIRFNEAGEVVDIFTEHF